MSLGIPASTTRRSPHRTTARASSPRPVRRTARWSTRTRDRRARSPGPQTGRRRRPRDRSLAVLRETTTCCRSGPGSPSPTSPAEAMVKWPNDVWLDGRKVAGILVEARRTRLGGARHRRQRRRRPGDPRRRHIAGTLGPHPRRRRAHARPSPGSARAATERGVAGHARRPARARRAARAIRSSGRTAKAPAPASTTPARSASRSSTAAKPRCPPAKSRCARLDDAEARRRAGRDRAQQLEPGVGEQRAELRLGAFARAEQQQHVQVHADRRRPSRPPARAGSPRRRAAERRGHRVPARPQDPHASASSQSCSTRDSR